jgi:hypothetical protein
LAQSFWRHSPCAYHLVFFFERRSKHFLVVRCRWLSLSPSPVPDQFINISVRFFYLFVASAGFYFLFIVFYFYFVLTLVFNCSDSTVWEACGLVMLRCCSGWPLWAARFF